MNEDIEVQLYSIYDELMEKPNRIREIFEDFYDADRVDMQGFPTYEELKENLESEPLTDKDSIGDKWFNEIFVLVHFPKVRVTNEFNRFIDITHLWAKVKFNWRGQGKGYFGLNRSEYTAVQFKADYMHSHVNRIPTNDFTYFATPCTGSGPINSTLATLSVGFDDAIWQLFCLELDRYVRVESIAGIPYHRLENVGSSQLGVGTNSFNMRTLFGDYNRMIFWEDDRDSRFIRHLLENKVLSFNYQNNQYGLAMPWIEFVITVSNSFIEWYNKEFNEGNITYIYEELVDIDIIKEAIIENGKVYYIQNRANTANNDIERFIGKRICTFKGEDVTLNITGLDIFDNIGNRVVILNLKCIELILGSILRVLNYSYGRKDNTREGSEEAASISSTKRYL